LAGAGPSEPQEARLAERPPGSGHEPARASTQR
jgi:pilus assembly protein CpaF